MEQAIVWNMINSLGISISQESAPKQLLGVDFPLVLDFPFTLTVILNY